MRKGDFSQILTGRNICPAANPNCDPLGRLIFENTIYAPGTDRLAPNGQRVRGNIIDPQLFNPVSLKIQKYFPEPNLPGLVSNYRSSYTNPRLTYIPSVKVNYNLSPTAKLSGYWSRTRVDSPNNDIWSPLPISGAVRRTSQADTIRVNYDRTLTRQSCCTSVSASFTSPTISQLIPSISCRHWDSQQPVQRVPVFAGPGNSVLWRHSPRSSALSAPSFLPELTT